MSMINRVLSDPRPKSIAEMRMDLKRVPKNQIIDAFINQTLFINRIKAQADAMEKQDAEAPQPEPAHDEGVAVEPV